jgi:hypothetical protein
MTEDGLWNIPLKQNHILSVEKYIHCLGPPLRANISVHTIPRYEHRTTAGLQRYFWFNYSELKRFSDIYDR